MRTTRRSSVGMAAFCASLLALAACGDDSKTSLLNQNAELTMRVVGRVIDDQTQQAVAARVTVCGHGTTETDSSGRFLIDVSGEQAVLVRIEASGFGTRETSVVLTASYENRERGPLLDETVDEATITNDLGTIGMRPKTSMNVTVTKNGAPVANAHVAAVTMEALLFEGDASSAAFFDHEDYQNLLASACGKVYTGVTDATGTAELAGLDSFQEYFVFCPAQDLDDDGVYDIDGDAFFGFEIAYDGTNCGLGVQAFEDAYLDVFTVDSNLISFLDERDEFVTGLIQDDNSTYENRELNGSFTKYAEDYNEGDLNGEAYFEQDGDTLIAANGALLLHFEGSVEVQSQQGFAPVFFYFDNMVSTGSSTHNEWVEIEATPTEVAGSNGTVWRFTPATTLPTNEFIFLAYYAQPTGQNDELDQFTFGSFYRPVLGNESIAAPRADNYNGSRDESSGVNEVFLEFDEIVVGSIELVNENDDGDVYTPSIGSEEGRIRRILQMGDSSLAVVFNRDAAPASGSNGSNCGATAARYFRVRLGGTYMGDHSGADTSSVDVRVNVRDAEGNERRALDTLLVR